MRKSFFNHHRHCHFRSPLVHLLCQTFLHLLLQLNLQCKRLLPPTSSDLAAASDDADDFAPSPATTQLAMPVVDSPLPPPPTSSDLPSSSNDADDFAPSPATTQLAMSAVIPPPVPPPTSSDLPASDDADDFDILKLQEEIIRLKEHIARRRKYKQEKAKGTRTNNTTQVVDVSHNVSVSTGSWLQTMSKPTTVKTFTCRNNADCGRDFVLHSTADYQNGDPVLCTTCWDNAKEELKSITSITGSKKPKKKVTKSQQQPTKTRKRSAEKQCPGTPDRKKQLTRKLTPPILKINKFQVMNIYISIHNTSHTGVL